LYWTWSDRVTFDFTPWLRRWNLTPDGESFTSPTGQPLMPVSRGGLPLMLKINIHPEERDGANLLVWWRGIGAVRVLEHDGQAIVMDRAADPRKLVDLSLAGHDDDALRILVRAASILHQSRDQPLPPTLIPMETRFRSLWASAREIGGFYAETAAVARALIDNPQDETVLHGDIQHYNVLDFGERGWLAIDPKGLIGERAYDFANIFCNPLDEVALSPGRVAHRATVLSDLTGIDRNRLLQWVVAYCGLSASWHLEDGTDPIRPITIANRARAELARIRPN
jgi:streptomycin 6-kinase